MTSLARIYKPAKTPTQSGKAKTNAWVLEFDQTRTLTVDPLMGYVSSSNTLSQIKLKFETQNAAIEYAQKNGIDYYVEEVHFSKQKYVCYPDNFKYDRKIPWTH
jgi:ETC complex I subunit conserved region